MDHRTKIQTRQRDYKMIEDFDKVLCEKYPSIFVNRHKSVQESCLAFGIETGPGWYNILDQLCANIQWRIDSSQKSHNCVIEYNLMRSRARAGNWELFNKYYDYDQTEDQQKRNREYILKSEPRSVPELVPQVVANQVKEKYGTLRFYYTGGDDVIDGMVLMAEAMSSVTCDVCGAPGKETGRSWFLTRCEEHTNK